MLFANVCFRRLLYVSIWPAAIASPKILIGPIKLIARES